MDAIRTLSVRLAMVGAALVLASAGILGLVAVVDAGPAVAAGTITQIAPFKGVAPPFGTPFSDQLRTSGNIGPVTFTTASATVWGTVSSTGAVSFSGTTSPGTYILFGTDADSSGDTGVWKYTLTCCRPPFIIQTAPTTGTVTTTGSAAFTDHLRTTGNSGPVTFTKRGGGTGIKVSSGGKITTTGTLAKGTYKATGTVADHFFDTGTWVYTLTVKAVTITQTAPTTGAVTTPGSATFTDHLDTTGNIGKRRFVKAGGGTGLNVSFGGKITTTGTLAKGTYKATGTVADHFGDTGTFTYTLTVKAVTITQSPPTSGSVTMIGSVAFTDQLSTIGNIGPVTFTKTGGGAGLEASSRGQITTTGTLASGTYTATGTMSDAFGDKGVWVYTLTVEPSFPRTEPTSGSVTVAGSAAFTVQLRTTSYTGPVTFTGGGTDIKVSSGGKITTTGTLVEGIYTATGTTSDAFGDTGTFTYVLIVKADTITQTGSTVANSEAG